LLGEGPDTTNSTPPPRFCDQRYSRKSAIPYDFFIADSTPCNNHILVPSPPTRQAAQNHSHTSLMASATNSVASSRSGTPQPNTALGERSAGEDASKLKTFLGILKKFIGVSDIAAVRFSLPAQLLEPIPNLEYWHYIDRPDAFAAIGDSEDPVGRMLGCLRFWFTKDLVCKSFCRLIGHTDDSSEIRARQAMQAIQLHSWRVLQGQYDQHNRLLLG